MFCNPFDLLFNITAPATLWLVQFWIWETVCFPRTLQNNYFFPTQSLCYCFPFSVWVWCLGMHIVSEALGQQRLFPQTHHSGMLDWGICTSAVLADNRPDAKPLGFYFLRYVHVYLRSRCQAMTKHGISKPPKNWYKYFYLFITGYLIALHILPLLFWILYILCKYFLAWLSVSVFYNLSSLFIELDQHQLYV